ncbi:MAG TPA: hypothetical protein VFP39_03790, partial [Gemmatimonadales bacterium]|nr:hypothetical protein [Gemmatimonadales bacterium]
MSPRASWPRWPAAALGAAVVGAWLAAGQAQDEGPARPAPGNSRTPCTFRSASIMPVAEMRGLGYTNNTRVLVDAKGAVWIALRSKHGSQYTIGLVRAEPPWHEGMKTSVTWIEDRDSLPFSGAPQRVAAIATGSDGSIHMAWYGGMAGAPDHQIHYARFTPGTTTRIAEESAPFRVPGFESVAVGAAKPIELWQEHASIAVGPDGTAHLAWEARDPSRRSSDGTPRPGIAYATRSPDGVW